VLGFHREEFLGEGMRIILPHSMGAATVALFYANRVTDGWGEDGLAENLMVS